VTWFEDLAGFREESPDQVRQHLSVDGNKLKSRINGREYIWGSLEIPTLAELRQRAKSLDSVGGRVSVREIVADAQDLHADPASAGAMFQVASQFNLLEMMNPGVIPEAGVGGYEQDHTQGPACAIAAGAGTIYRNYFAGVNGQTGQSAGSQIDCLNDVGEALGNADNRLWEMKNGYALATEEGLKEISRRLLSASEQDRDELRRLLRIGLQWDTEVTIANTGQLVSQAYCSALPVACSPYASELWVPFARLILEASYESTFCAAVLNASRTGNTTLYLTLLGGGAFGNRTEWITDAVTRSLKIHENSSLDVAIVSYGASNSDVQRLVRSFSG